jgi:hypothetical protein
MVALKRSDFHTALDNNINVYAKNQVKWSLETPRDSTYMDTTALASLSDFNLGDGAPAGDADASTVVAIIKAEAIRCSAIRKVYTARYYSGSNYTDGYQNQEWGIAALNDSYRQDIYSLDTAGGHPNYVATNNNADWSNLTNLIQSVQDELYDRINNSTVIDLSVCHTSCHNNCHSSRSRR